MTGYSFSLIPFPASNIPNIRIAGKISRQNNLLTIHYFLNGETENILFPETLPHPTRKDELWKATCFEFFLAIQDHPQYWEFNMSSSGDWNVYYMDAYRRVGFREETAIQQLQFDLRDEAGCLLIDAMVVLDHIVQKGNPIKVGITSVIQTKDQNETYWALAHPNPQADFHLRESFTIQL
jgi:hypothetical protein